MTLFDLTRTLVNMDSVTGNERACGLLLRDHLTTCGFQVKLLPVEGERANVFATLGLPEIVLSTHMDTVPPFYPAKEDDEFIHGRGSCDAKGILAAQVEAAKRLKSDGVSDFGLLFLVGEETLSDGARVANERPVDGDEDIAATVRYMINGEPTENKLAVGSKGILRVDIRARGRMAHSAYPHLGESAIDKLIEALNDLRRMPLPVDPVLGPATLNIGVISGGRAANVVPDEAHADVLIRTVNGTEELRQSIRRVLDGRCEYEFIRETPALKMETLDGFETDRVAFATDLPNLTRWGRPLLLGPGSINVAHTDHERVRKSDLTRAVDLYGQLVRQLKRKIEN
jgi:acetylornithine deacetylase